MNKYSTRGFWIGALALSSLLPASCNAGKAESESYDQSSSSSYGAKWHFFGPAEALSNPEDPLLYYDAPQISGRVASMAIGHTCDAGQCRLWIGSAGGGLWRTDDALNETAPSWTYLGNHFDSSAIGCLVLDPNDTSDRTLYVGTGETNFNATSLASSGLYKTKDGGRHFKRVSTLFNYRGETVDFTDGRGVSSIAIVPGDPQTIYVTTATAGTGMTPVRTGMSNITGRPQAPVGLYKTTDGGHTWLLLWEPVPFEQPDNPNGSSGFIPTSIGAKKVQLDPTDFTTVYVTAFGNNIHRSAPGLENGDDSFKPIYIADFGEFVSGEDLAQFDVVKAPNGRPRIYVGNGIFDLDKDVQFEKQLLWRFDNADVPAENMASLGVNSDDWVQLTTNDQTVLGGSGRNYCLNQCSYNQVVISPPGEPDTLYVAGTFGGLDAILMPTLFSRNAGTSSGPTETVFHPVDGTGILPPEDTFGHVDVHAVVFNPQNPNIVFIGSDGGVIRTNGNFTDQGAECDFFYPPGDENDVCKASLAEVPEQLIFMNKDLSTMQIWGTGVDLNDPLGRMLIGTQDNGTQLFDGSKGPKVFEKVNFGDGTSANGFHTTKPNICFSSFQSDLFFTSYENCDLNSWLYTALPIALADETVSTTLNSARQLLTIDRVLPDTQYTGYEHIWRTQNNGGDRALLEASGCLVTADFDFFQPECGDWVALGIAMSDTVPRELPGADSDDPLRNPGNLTSSYYGADRLNGIISAIGRAEYNKDGSSNANTLWAGTSNGRLFISNNADAVSSDLDGRDVTFVRIDPPSMPARFVSAIEVDPNNANHAFISYAGFSAVSPGDHVYEVCYHPSTQTITFKSLEYNIDDTPVDTIAYDSQTGDLYAGFDTGVKILQKGTKEWKSAGSDFPVAAVPSLTIVPEERLLIAGTHGRGVWYLRLPH